MVFSDKSFTMNDQTYSQIFTGDVSEKEKKAFYEELSGDETKREEFIRLKKLWDLSEMSRNKISFQRKSQLFREFRQTSFTQKQTTLQQLYNGWKYAAVIVLSLLAGFWLNSLFKENNGGWKQFHSGNGSISSVLLEDGSKIWLNSNTTLSLNEKETMARLEGEAHFEIRHDEERFFTVDLGAIKVRDLGTTFNISAYPEEDYVRTTLLDGEIAILDQGNKEIRKVTVNETFCFKKADHTYTTEQLDRELVTGWMENKFVFIDMPLLEICREIEKWYGVSIQIENEQLKTEKYTSVIRRTTTVNQLMEMFKLTTGINYRIKEQEGRKPVIYFSK